MFRKFFMAFVLITLIGCHYFPDDFERLMRDPHYTRYQQQLNELESSYLKGSLSYADYLEKKKQIDDTYTQEVQEREQIIHP